MSFDKIFDLTAEVYFNFYNIPGTRWERQVRLQTYGYNLFWSHIRSIQLVHDGNATYDYKRTGANYTVVLPALLAGVVEFCLGCVFSSSSPLTMLWDGRTSSRGRHVKEIICLPSRFKCLSVVLAVAVCLLYPRCWSSECLH